MRRSTFSILCALLVATSCIKMDFIFPGSGSTDNTTYYANLFAYNGMQYYYLWEKEISSELGQWKTSEDPIAKVAAIRYKDGNGNDIDKWTELMEDCSPFTSLVSGNGKTFGMDFVLYGEGNRVVPQITFTYADSPAAKAGLKRGDRIDKVDGIALTRDNYADILNEKLYNAPGILTLELENGPTLRLTAVEMYSNPVNVVRTLSAGDKKLGYLHFSNFTDDAVTDLETAFKGFKADGIDELVLDLRYNTGGYVSTAIALASMIAPEAAVSAQKVFNKSVYNRHLTELLKENECFDPKYLPANPGIEHLWVIVTGHSASASESLICGLLPYMQGKLTLVGSNTYGKFCGGFLITAEEWYDALAEESLTVNCEDGKKSTAGWGLYVIASRYADCNGITRSMPSGIPADYEALDRPADGYQLGDPEESMLAEVLRLSAGAPLVAKPAVKGSAAEQAASEELPFERPGAGALLL